MKEEMKESIKLCEDCVHHGYHHCYRLVPAEYKFDYITGETLRSDSADDSKLFPCQAERETKHPMSCGHSGTYFKPKPKGPGPQRVLGF